MFIYLHYQNESNYKLHQHRQLNINHYTDTRLTFCGLLHSCAFVKDMNENQWHEIACIFGCNFRLCGRDLYMWTPHVSDEHCLWTGEWTGIRACWEKESDGPEGTSGQCLDLSADCQKQFICTENNNNNINLYFQKLHLKALYQNKIKIQDGKKIIILEQYNIK